MQFDEAQGEGGGKQISLDRYCKLPMDGYRVYGPMGSRGKRRTQYGDQEKFRLVGILTAMMAGGHARR